MSAIGELHKLETADGKMLVLPSDDVLFLAYGNYGNSEINFVTRRGYQQHGVTEVGYTLGTRAISIDLYMQPGCTRQEYWDNRQLLLNFLRPNRNGPLTLTLRQPNGAERAIIVRADPGLMFPGNQQSNNDWDIQEPIEFIAFDPIWFDPTEVSSDLAGVIAAQLVFPITFDDKNIFFGESGLTFQAAITYTGTWETYPKFTISGPYTSVKITHVQTGVVITLNVAITSGKQRILDLTPGAQSLVDRNGVNKFGELGPLSNLVDFNIRPDPETAGGLNTIKVELIGGIGGDSGVTLAYKTRYIAI